MLDDLFRDLGVLRIIREEKRLKTNDGGTSHVCNALDSSGQPALRDDMVELKMLDHVERNLAAHDRSDWRTVVALCADVAVEIRAASSAYEKLARLGDFVGWLFAGCRMSCDHERAVAYVLPLCGGASWRHADDGSDCLLMAHAGSSRAELKP